MSKRKDVLNPSMGDAVPDSAHDRTKRTKITAVRVPKRVLTNDQQILYQGLFDGTDKSLDEGILDQNPDPFNTIATEAGQKVIDGQTADAGYEAEVPLRTAVPRYYTTASQADFFQRAARAELSDPAAMANLLGKWIFIVLHKISDAPFETHISYATHLQFDQNAQTKTRLKRNAIGWQSAICDWYIAGVKNTRAMYPKDKFDLAPPVLRMKIWMKLFGRAQSRYTEGMHGPAAKVLDIPAIFGLRDPVMAKWADLFLHMFVWTCEMIVKRTYGLELGAVGKAERLRVYDGWRDLVRTDEWERKAGEDFWHVDNLPVRNGNNIGLERQSNYTSQDLIDCMAPLPVLSTADNDGDH